MNVLSLFSGIGLHDLGLERAGMRTVAFCENDPWCREVLKKHWPEVPCFDDVRTLSADALRSAGVERVDLITGGFPCQPHSVAGSRKGVEDERWLWPDYARLIRELRPSWVLAENVPGIRTTAIDLVLADLEAAGYACWPLVVGADDVGAPHRRKRVWIVAYRNGAGHEGERSGGLLDGERTPRGYDADRRGERAVGDNVSNPEGERRQEQGDGRVAGSRAGCDGTRWPARPGEPRYDWEAPRLTQSRVGGAAHGYARRVDSLMRRSRLKGLGNANPPQVVEAIGRVLMEHNYRGVMNAHPWD